MYWRQKSNAGDVAYPNLQVMFPEDLSRDHSLGERESEQPTRLGRFKIRSKLGAGGMGEVYLADDPSLRRAVAIKVLRPDLIANKDRLHRFEREAYAASSLNHPNILTIYEFGREADYHFIVTELVEGESLGQFLRREPMNLHEVLEIGIQIASALAAAHAAGIIHRDIKPDNIMLRRDRLVKVLDFGLAKLSEETRAIVDTEVMSEGNVTIPGVVMGTARYMSPEQARGLPVDTRTDIWSLGVVLYQMTAGQPPFVGKTMSDVIAAVLTSEAPPLSNYSPDVPAELQCIVARTLKKSRGERYQAINEVEQDLKTLNRRMEFEAELAQQRGGLSEAVTKPIARAASTKATSSPDATDKLTHVHSTSSAEYLVGEFKRHKRGALLVLSAILALVIAASYFALTRYFTGQKVGITSLAVLPFVNTSKDPEKEYLSDGISESLVNRLSQLPGVKVISNTSSARYKGNDIDLLEVARALDVSALLTGRILQRGDNLSISVELINANDRTQLWGRQYTRKATDLVSVQAEISKEIAENLRLRLTPGQQQQLVEPEAVNPEAYELLLKGRFFRSRGRTEDREKAADFFNQAIAVDPGYAPAYADLSDIYRSLVASSILDPEEYLAKAKTASQKALELNPNLAEAHYTQANLKTYDWEWEDAEREYKRAIELDSNLALAHRWYASYLRVRGRHDEAIIEINRARELDPLSPGVNATVGYLLLSARQYDRAIESLKKTLELDQRYPYAHLFLGFTYGAKEMYPEAIAAYEQAIKLGLDTPTTKIYLAATFARGGNRRRAQTMLEDLQKRKDRVSPGELAILQTAMGEHEEAFASLEKAYETHDVQLQYLGVSYWFDPLRSDPRFQDLMHKVGLSQ